MGPMKQLALDIGLAPEPTLARFFVGANAALLQHCNLSATHGAQLVAQNAYFIDCNLSNAQWPEANLLGSRLRKVCLEQVDLRSSNLHGLRSEGANSKEIYLNHALMTRCNLREDLASG